MPVTFTSETQTATFYSPLADFEETTVEVEVREDPLTGRQARIVPGSFLMPDDEPDIADVVEDDEGCFFCPGTVSEVTPKYPDWVGFERGSVGEATSFPNLNPYAGHSNVVALTEDHFRPIDAFTPEIFTDGLAAALEYIARVFEHDGDAAYATVNMNFLRPAGSSIIHPHLQTLVDDRGTSEQRALLDASRAYHDEHGDDFWSALVAAEAGGERHIGTTGSVEWLAPFAPRHHRHVRGVADTTGVPAHDDEVVADLAAGLVNVLSFYGDVGLNSFNFVLYLAPDEPSMPPVIDVVSRSVFDRYYWSDSPFFTVLHGEGVVDVAPEAYAAAAREQF
jgi:UDPglucose--hexose-1-phosphate uridylyltransferase